MSLMNMGHSTPNNHHTNHKNTNSYHNRHSNPPKHHPHGLITNKITSPSPQTQLKQIELSKSDIFNNPQANTPHSNNNNQYIYHSQHSQQPSQSISKSDIFNGFNSIPSGHVPTNTNMNQPSPIYKENEETLIDYKMNSMLSPTSNTQPYNNNNNTCTRAHTSHQHSYNNLPNNIPSGPPIMNQNNSRSLDMYHSHNRHMGGPNMANSNTLPPRSPNMSPSVSLDQYNYANNRQLRKQQQHNNIIIIVFTHIS